MKARRMEMVAYGRRAGGEGQMEMGRELRGGRVQCENCYKLRFQPLPFDTSELRVRALAERAEKGDLYLATLS